MIFLEGGGYTMVFVIILILMMLPAIILSIIGAVLYYNGKRKTPKILFIIAIVYVLVSLGICGSMMMLN